MSIETQRIALHTTDGLRLDGDLAGLADARAAVVVCHPHPRFGGDRFSPVVEACFTRAAAAGMLALRFDFRGVNGSEGTHDGGDAERLDVVAAIDEVAARTDSPIWLCGYSFGSVVALDVVDSRLAGWLAIAPPLGMSPSERAAGRDARPKHLLLAGHDQFAAPAVVDPLVVGWANTETTVLGSADHFLAGHLTQVADWVVGSITRSSRNRILPDG